jgi:hypothetical protein
MENKRKSISKKLRFEIFKRDNFTYERREQLELVLKWNMPKTIKKYGINEVIESTKLSFKQYYDKNDENIAKIIDFIPRICARRLEQKDKPFLSKIFYIKAIMRNRFGNYDDERIMDCLTNIIKIKLDYDIICGFSKTARSWTMFWKLLNDYYGGDW